MGNDHMKKNLVTECQILPRNIWHITGTGIGTENIKRLVCDVPGEWHILSLSVLTIVSKLRTLAEYTWNRSVAIFLKYFTLTRPTPTVYTSTPAACKILAGRTTLSRDTPVVTRTSTLLRPHVGLPRKRYLLTNIRAWAVLLPPPRRRRNLFNSW